MNPFTFLLSFDFSPFLSLDSQHFSLGVLLHVFSENVVELNEVLEELFTVSPRTIELEAKVHQLEDLVSEYVRAEDCRIFSVALAHLVVSCTGGHALHNLQHTREELQG